MGKEQFNKCFSYDAFNIIFKFLLITTVFSSCTGQIGGKPIYVWIIIVILLAVTRAIVEYKRHNTKSSTDFSNPATQDKQDMMGNKEGISSLDLDQKHQLETNYTYDKINKRSNDFNMLEVTVALIFTFFSFSISIIHLLNAEAIDYNLIIQFFSNVFFAYIIFKFRKYVFEYLSIDIETTCFWLVILSFVSFFSDTISRHTVSVQFLSIILFLFSVLFILIGNKILRSLKIKDNNTKGIGIIFIVQGILSISIIIIVTLRLNNFIPLNFYHLFSLYSHNLIDIIGIIQMILFFKIFYLIAKEIRENKKEFDKKFSELYNK